MTSLHDELEKKLHDSDAAPISLPLEFLKAITCDFSSELELGRGGYGVVYKGILKSGKIIAVKKLFDISILDDATFRNEVISIMEIKHQHVVKFIGYCAESSWQTIKQPSGNIIWAETPKRLLCFEYVCNKSLGNYISDKSSVLDWNMRYDIIKGICSGLNFLHEEWRIVHLDLKPENILMDAAMIPKIADFGLSRIFVSQQSRIITNNRAGSHGYMAPEYLFQGIISKKADIFSVGVIIIETITGHRDYPYFQLDSPHSTAMSCQHFIEEVVGSWRNKFESTTKYTPMEKYIEQVKQCVTIALKCVNPDMMKRPTGKDIVQVLNAVDQMEANNKSASEMQSKDKSLVLDTALSKELIPHNTIEDMYNIDTDGIVGYMEQPQECLSPTPSWKTTTSSEHHDEEAESSGPRQSIDPTSDMKAHEELSSDMLYTKKLLVLNSSASKDRLAPHSFKEDMLNNKIDGEVVTETTSEGFSPTLSFESSTDNPNYQEAVEEFNEPQLSINTTTEVTASFSEILDVHPLELSFPLEPSKLITCSLHLTNNKDKQVVFRLMEKTYNWESILKLPLYGIVAPRSTYTLVVTVGTNERLPEERSVDLILHSSVSGEYVTPFRHSYAYAQYFEAKKLENAVHMVTLKAVYTRNGKTYCEESFFPTPLCTSSPGSQNHRKEAMECSEPQEANDKTIEVTPGTNMLLDVYPLELSFHFEPNKLITCSLDLRNNTDEQVAFGLLKSDEQTCFVSSLPLFGIVDPGTTYTLLVIMNKHEKLPQERNIDLILHTSMYYTILSAPRMLMLQNAEEVILKGVCALPGETTFKSTTPSVKIISMEDSYSVQHISTIDANQTEPLIITGHLFGYVHIWNYDTQKCIGSINLPKGATVCSVKFIVGTQWFLAGSCDGFIHMYLHCKNGKQKNTSLKAHDSYVNSLAIHPTESYVLSVCTTEIKLWGWNQGCFGLKCIQTFEEQSDKINAVAFNPKDANSFVAACDNGTIKVCSLDSPKSKYTLSGHSGGVESLDFFTRDGQQYLITGSYDKTAKIWDMPKMECIRTLPHRSEVLSVLPHPKFPLLVTGTSDGDIYLWSSTNFSCVIDKLAYKRYFALDFVSLYGKTGECFIFPRIKRILNIGSISRVRGLACLIESGRVVVAHQNRVSVIEIRDEEQQYCSEVDDESISATDSEI